MTAPRDAAERLRRFLLGDISDSEREIIERQCLAEHSLIFEQLAALEDELRFDYLQGKLSPADFARFERRFVGTPEGRARLAFAQALLLAADGAPITPAPRAVSRWGQLVVMAVLGAAVVALAVTAGIQFAAARKLRLDLEAAQAGVSQNSTALAAAQAEVARSQSTLATLQANATAAREELAREQTHVEELAHQLEAAKHTVLPPVPAPGNSASAAGAAASAPVASLTLKPGLLSSGQELVKIDTASVTKGLQLSLTLPNTSAAYAMYAAALLNAEGKPVWTAAHLTRAGKAVAFIVPAGHLKRADYQVLLRGIQGDGRAADLAGYAFRVAGGK